MKALNEHKLALTTAITAVIVRFVQIIIIKALRLFTNILPTQKNPWSWGWGWGKGEMTFTDKMIPWMHSVAWLIGTFVIMYAAGYIFAYIYNYLMNKK